MLMYAAACCCTLLHAAGTVKPSATPNAWAPHKAAVLTAMDVQADIAHLGLGYQTATASTAVGAIRFVPDI